ncbi:hypothetical protein [Bradyrhizobium sp. RDI18]|uniref:hypothetical protein n=1 Tax=Bradyrhizobium sp. RDI18 TaxID=3367400 RepID=UPI0037137C48
MDSNRNFRVLQSTGWVLTTLTEARNRADLFIVAGSDIHQHHPRFFERIVCNEASMFADDPPKRTVVFLGDQLDQSAVKGKRIGEVLSLPRSARSHRRNSRRHARHEQGRHCLGR